MKKDNNAIKRLLKHTDVKDLHGYFKQDDNYILCNSISVIKFDSNNIDFLDDIEQSQSIHYSYNKFNNMFNDIKKAIQDNNNTIEINIQDLKMWKKYADKSKPFIFKICDKYAGVNAAYLLDLATLTRQDKNNAVTIQANNNKTPLYIAGNDVSAVLCPIGLKQGYNENDYNSFIDSLTDCYTKEKAIQEEKHAKKAAKSTKTIEKETLYNGFTLYFAGRQLFILSDKKRVTNDITNDFMKIMSDITGIDYIKKITENDYKYYKSGVQTATITKTTSYYGTEEIYRIETKYNSENFYKNEYDRLIIYNGNMEKIDICADDMSATDEETPKIATIQDNNADIVKDDTCTDTDKAATTDTANNDSVTATQDIKTADTTTQDTSNNAITSETMQADARQDTPHKTSKKAMCLFIVTDKPAPVKLPTLKQLDRIPMYVEHFKTDLQPLKSHRVYNNRVKELKPLKKAYNDFKSTVSHNNDKCAIGGKVAAGNTS